MMNTQKIMKIGARKRKEKIGFYLCISPWIIGFLLFTAIPMACSLYFSFNKVSVISLSTIGPKFVGFANYKAVFSDSLFVGAIANTFIMAFLKTFLTVVISLIFACCLNSGFFGNKLVRVLVYLPAVIPGVAGAMVWAQLFSSDASLLNNILALVGIPARQWLSLENARSSIILMGVWCGIGPTMVLFIAALQNVPESLLEAAKLDGAGPLTRFAVIIFPCISPTILYQVITALIGGLQSYTEVKVLLGNGTDTTITMTMSVVMNAFSNMGNKTMGYASAQAWVLFLIILVFTIFFFWASKRFVYYEAKDEN